MRLAPRQRIGLVVLTLVGCGQPKPTAPVVVLAPATDTVTVPYGEVAAGAWLGGTRWVVLAPANEAVELVDFASAKVAPFERGGRREVQHPATLYRIGDTVYIGDWARHSTTLWTTSGKLVGAIPSTDLVRGVLPRARDGRGRFYLDLPPRPGPDGSGNRDSAAVVRAGPALETVDTVARLAPLDFAVVESEAGRRFERRVFSGSDRWGVLADGSLWVARVYQNRVDWRSPDGHWARGQVLPDRVLEVTRYDRELFVRNFPPELRATAEQLPFAAIKPPFENGFTTPGGDVWLEKSRAPADSSQRYQVVDRAGRLVREVRVPGSGRIIAMEKASVLVAEPSPDGSRLLRFTVPALSAGGLAASRPQPRLIARLHSLEESFE